MPSNTGSGDDDWRSGEASRTPVRPCPNMVWMCVIAKRHMMSIENKGNLPRLTNMFRIYPTLRWNGIVACVMALRIYQRCVEIASSAQILLRSHDAYNLLSTNNHSK